MSNGIVKGTPGPHPTTTAPTRKARIISIGMFKTGTRTLMTCFKQLGFTTSSYTFNQERLARWCSGEPFLNDEDVQDEPVFAFWRQIADAYPDARFIMTTREFDPWVKSCQRNFRDPRDVRIEKGHAVSVMREGKLERRIQLEKILADGPVRMTPVIEWLLGIHGGGLDESREAYEKVYESHHRDVLEYFNQEGKKDRLFLWDLTKVPRWEPLCEWLGVPVPPVEFPWVNKTKDRFKWVQDAQKEHEKEPSRARLHMNPALFEQVRAMDIRVGDVTAVTNQIITARVEVPQLANRKPTIKLWSDDKKIVLDPYYLVWIHRRNKREPASE